MASNSKKSKRRYSGPRPVDGNLARKPNVRELERQLDRSGRMDFDQLYEPQQVNAIEQNARRRQQKRSAMRPALRVSPMVLLGFLCAAFLMVVLLLCYVRMNTISRNVVSMKNEIEQLKIEQVSLLTQYEQKFDLASVKAAAEAAGMSQPSESQIYYIDLPGADQAVAYGSESGGVLDKFFASLGRDVYAVMEYFR